MSKSPDGFFTDRSGRTRPVYGVRLEIQDQAQPYLEHLAKTFPKEFNKALKYAVGAETRQRLVDAIAAGGPKSRKWPRLAEIYKTKGARPRFIRKSGSRRFYGRMARAISYYFDPRQQRVIIGWGSESAEKIYRENLATGSTSKVTPKLQRFWYMSKKPLSPERSSIKIPARPLIEPVWKEEGPDILRHFEERLLRYVKKTSPKMNRLTRYLK